MNDEDTRNTIDSTDMEGLNEVEEDAPPGSPISGRAGRRRKQHEVNEDEPEQLTVRLAPDLWKQLVKVWRATSKYQGETVPLMKVVERRLRRGLGMKLSAGAETEMAAVDEAMAKESSTHDD